MSLNQVRGAVPVVARDSLGVVGVALICIGLWQIYRPLGLISAGLFAMAGSWFLTRGSVAR
jgi:hypothetical protein